MRTDQERWCDNHGHSWVGSWRYDFDCTNCYAFKERGRVYYQSEEGRVAHSDIKAKE